MSKIIAIKEFRKNLSSFADLVSQGQTIIVIRRSEPAFKVIPIENLEGEDQWQELIDFTDGGKKKGIQANKLVKFMEDFEKKHE